MGERLADSDLLKVTGKIMIVAIIVLFVVVVFVFFLHLYAKWFWYRQQDDAGPVRRRRRRFNFAAGHRELSNSAAFRRGLDPLILKSIPVVNFAAADFKEGLECAVCLSDVSEGEKARLLPMCNHGFHVECIDMWFQSHSTCPLCRNPVSDHSESSLPFSLSMDSDNILPHNPTVTENSVESQINFPTNVLYWGNETEVSTLSSCLEEGDRHRQGDGPTSTAAACSSSSSSSSSCTNRGDGGFVIDIPRQISEEEDQKSPLPMRVRSFKRLLSRGDRRVNPSSPTSGNVDVELQQLGRGQN